ncbi:MAG: hypothetical protein ACRELC_05950 [Gemmatimonadota bacterium]
MDEANGVAPPGAGAGAEGDAPLGTAHLPVSCDGAVQEEFDRGVALLHHMTYPQARQTFERVAAADPECAMAHWGIAMTLFQPMWPTRPGPEALARGWREVEQALAPPTPRESLYVATTEAFFRDPEAADYQTRIARWERAAEALHRAHPEDREAAALYALAHLATAPISGGSLAHHERAGEILLGIYRQEPTHAGAIHYTTTRTT